MGWIVADSDTIFMDLIFVDRRRSFVDFCGLLGNGLEADKGTEGQRKGNITVLDGIRRGKGFPKSLIPDTQNPSITGPGTACAVCLMVLPRARPPVGVGGSGTTDPDSASGCLNASSSRLQLGI